MCRNIKNLRRDTPPVTEAEFEEAARNLVRKLSGFREPSAANREIFETAVSTICRHSRTLLANLQIKQVSKQNVQTKLE